MAVGKADLAIDGEGLFHRQQRRPLRGQKLAQLGATVSSHNLVLSAHGSSLLFQIRLARFYQNRAERAASTFN